MPGSGRKMFTDDEWIAALSIVLPPEQAREQGLAFNSLPDLQGYEDAAQEPLMAAGAKGPRSYDGDLLDLLSLVSDSCAERAWRLLGISHEEGRSRREVFRLRVQEALRSKE